MSILTAITIQAVLFVLYTAFIWHRFGVLTSISASSYFLKGNVRYLFAGWLISLAILTYWQDIGAWGHLMSVGFVVTGMSIEHRRSSDLEDEFHTYGTLLLIVAGFGGLFFLHGIWLPALVMAVGAVFFFLITAKWVWWTEIWAFVTIFAGHFLRGDL